MKNTAVQINKIVTTDELIEDIVFVIDLKGRILSIDKEIETQFGYNEEELSGMFITHICLHELNKEVMRNLEFLLEGTASSCFLPLISKTGQLVPFEITVNKGDWYGEKALYCSGHNISVTPISQDVNARIFNSVSIPLVLYSLQHNVFVDVNKTFELTFGIQRTDIIGRQLRDFNFFRNSENMEDAIVLFEDENCLKEFETVLSTTTGNELTCSVSADFITMSSTEFLLISIADISKVKETEHRLNHQLNQQKLIADISQELNSSNFYTKLDHILEMLGEHTGVSRVYIFEDSDKGLNTNNTFEWCNTGIDPQKSNLQGIPYELIPSWKKILISEGRIFSQNIVELPVDLQDILEPQGIKSILIFPLYAEDIFIGFIGFDECTRNYEWRQDELDLLKLISNILSNAIERRVMLQKITEKQIRLELAVGNAQEGIWDWNLKTDEVFFDSTWSHMLGHDATEIITQIDTWENLLHPDDKAKAKLLLKDHLSGRTDFLERTYRLKTKSGKWKWILDKGKIIAYDEQNKPLRAIGKHTDLTEIKNTEEKLRLSIDKEKELNDLKSRFIANASHEFRTPLASILLISNVLNQYWAQLDHSDITARINKISEQANHLTNIVANVFEISKFQDGQIDFKPENIDLVALSNTIIADFNLPAESENRISFYTPLKSLALSLDPQLITKAMSNLISNSLKYSAEDTFVQVKLLQTAREVQIHIIDSGIGIPLKDQKHLFQPFFRAGNTGHIPGNGLGLNIARESVILHGGKLKFSGKPGRHSTFVICLPKRLVIL